jgi:hypothetical protein
MLAMGKRRRHPPPPPDPEQDPRLATLDRTAAPILAAAAAWGRAKDSCNRAEIAIAEEHLLAALARLDLVPRSWVQRF